MSGPLSAGRSRRATAAGRAVGFTVFAALALQAAGSLNWISDWTQIAASSSWQGVEFGRTVLMSNDSVLLLGGLVGGNLAHLNGTVFASHSCCAQWDLVSPNPAWAPLKRFAAARNGQDHVFVFGGESPDGTFHDAVWRSEDFGLTWNTLTSTLPQPRAGHAVVWTGSQFVLTSGTLSSGTPQQDAWVVDDAFSANMALEQNSMWGATTEHGLAALPSGRVALAGGHGYGTTKLNLFNVRGPSGQWTSPGSGTWSGRSSFLMLPTGPERLLVVGGDTGGDTFSDEAWEGVAADGTWQWTQLSTKSWEARSLAMGVTVPNASTVYVMGGWNGSAYFSDVWAAR